MTTHTKFGIGALLAVFIALVAVSIFFMGTSAKANPLGFSCPSYTATATTSPAFMTPGTATSTLLFDMYCVNGTNQPNTGNTHIANTLALLTQFSASSSATSILNIKTEYSQDNVDWYEDDFQFFTDATSTGSHAFALPQSAQWVFATSTVNGLISASSNRGGKVIRLNPPTRYVRIVYTLSGTTNGAVWGSILPIKENQ